MARLVFSEDFEKYFVSVCNNSQSMAQAAATLSINYKTLCQHAKRLNCFKSNQSGKKIKKSGKRVQAPLSLVFQNKVLLAQSHKIKLRLIAEGFKQSQCEHCSLRFWMNKPIPLELHHIDGDRFNNSLENLVLLCPNCHALTDNYRSKNCRNLSARRETSGVESLKVGEACDGNPEPSSGHPEKV